METDVTKYANYQGLLAAVCSDPDDDTVRLVFADWLEEHSCPERAEFIRVQCELARMPAGWPISGDASQEVDKYKSLRDCERELLEAFGADWAASVAIHTATDWHSHGTYRENHESEWKWYWSRGFISHISLTAADWLKHADALYWRPGQRVAYPECKGTGWTQQEKSCPVDHVAAENTIDGLVRFILRPCPDTAQPLRKVVLTTRPDRGVGGMENEPGVMEKWFAARWPGIEFELPPPQANSVHFVLTPSGDVRFTMGRTSAAWWANPRQNPFVTLTPPSPPASS
jgi:uncharacterized protein (TIGR02996 family)